MHICHLSKITPEGMCLILLTTFLFICSSVQGDYGDISFSNFDGRGIMTEIERSKLQYIQSDINWRTLPVWFYGFDHQRIRKSL